MCDVKHAVDRDSEFKLTRELETMSEGERPLRHLQHDKGPGNA